MSKFFEGITTAQELKTAYRDLARTHHPDNGGDTATMQAINAEYAFLAERIDRAANPDKTAEQFATMQEVNEALRVVIQSIAHIDVTIEVVGLWLWVSGNTYPHKDALKRAGFKWASKKKMWYYAGVKSNGRGRKSYAEIKNTYGAKTVQADEKKALNG